MGIVDVWGGSHLAATLHRRRRTAASGWRPPPEACEGRGAAAAPDGPWSRSSSWSSKNCCERCGDGFSLANARHHCRACGASGLRRVLLLGLPGARATLAALGTMTRSGTTWTYAKEAFGPDPDKDLLVEPRGSLAAAGNEAPAERTAVAPVGARAPEVGPVGGPKRDASARSDGARTNHRAS